MLTELHITDFALIQRLSMTFGPGLNVLTGETGAGKSIIIDAIGSVLGERADADLVRTEAERARVDALFLLADGFPCLSDDPAGIAEEAGSIDPSLVEDGQMVITREIARNGRSGIRVNGRPATLVMVREMTGHLVDLHGQHEHQSLLDPRNHGDVFDGWIGRPALSARSTVRDRYERWRMLRNERSSLVTDERKRTRRLDLLRYQVEEIDAARLRPGEEEELRADRARLAGAEKLHACAAEAMGLLSEGEASAVENIGIVVSRLRDAATIDPELTDILATVENALYVLEDGIRELSRYRDEIEFNPVRLNEVEERIDLLRGLRRKYGDTIEEVLSYRNESTGEIESLENAEERSKGLDEAVETAYRDLVEACEALTAVRKGAAPEFSRAMLVEMADLGLEKARFEVRLADALSEPTPRGAERIEFLLSANPGEPLKPLASVASGGEMSRIMLALRTVAARTRGIPVMIFDEIDNGVGGRTGSVLAVKLRNLGERNQVLCVTHLPQIAAAAHHHFSIQKAEEEGRTVVRVEEVRGEERVAEVARMLGGATQSATRHARELIESVSCLTESAHD